MLDLTWKVFCMTGSVDTYLLMKEMEEDEVPEVPLDGDPAEFELNQTLSGDILEP